MTNKKDVIVANPKVNVNVELIKFKTLKEKEEYEKNKK